MLATSGALVEGPISRLFVRIGGALIPLAIERVSWFEADGDYVIAHAGSARRTSAAFAPTNAGAVAISVSRTSVKSSERWWPSARTPHGAARDGVPKMLK